MKDRKQNIIITVLVVVLLGGGLLFSCSPNLDLKDSILNMVELPKNVFTFVGEKISGKKDKDAQDDAITFVDANGNPVARKPQGDTPENGVQKKVETPLILFDDVEGNNGETVSGAGNAAGTGGDEGNQAAGDTGDSQASGSNSGSNSGSSHDKDSGHDKDNGSGSSSDKDSGSSSQKPPSNKKNHLPMDELE